MPKKLLIHRLFFTASDCYKAGTKQQIRGVQVHSTGANNPWLRRYVGPDDGLLGVNKNGNHSNQPGSSVCASAYIGRLADGTIGVYQTLPWDYRCWLSGSSTKGNANKLGYVGFEICEDSMANPTYYHDAMEAAAQLTAHLCELIGAMPDERGPCGLVVMDHRELHAAGYASNHADILHWARRHGQTMDDFRARVRQIMLDGQEVIYTESRARPTLRTGSKGDDVTYMQLLLSAHGFDVEPDSVFGALTASALMAFQAERGLAADGVCGPMTWAALAAADQETKDAEDDDDGGGQDPGLAVIIRRLREMVDALESVIEDTERLTKEQ